MCVPSNYCAAQIIGLQTERELLGQWDVVPEKNHFIISRIFQMLDLILNFGIHLRNTTRCIAVKNSSKERQPSWNMVHIIDSLLGSIIKVSTFVTSDSCHICRSS